MNRVPSSSNTHAAAGTAACIVLAVLPYAHTVALRNVALGLGLLAMIVGWRTIAPPRSTRAFAIGPFIGLFIAWAGWGALSMIWAIDREYSASELQSEVMYAVLVFGLFYAISDRPWLERFRRTIMATTFLSLLVVIAWRIAEWSNWLGHYYNGPGLYSTYLCAVYPFALTWLLAPSLERRDRALNLALVIVIVIGGWLTINRMFWIVIALETVAVVMLMPRRASARRALALRAGIAVATLAILAGTLYAVSSARFALSPSTPGAVAETALTDVRQRIWPYALQRFAERPLTGAGFGRGALRADFRREFSSPLIWHAHNIVLNYALALGAPGVVLILVVFGLPLTRLATMRRDADAALRPYALAGVVMVLGLFAKSMTDDLFYRQTALFYWAVAGMCLGAFARSLRTTPES